MTAPSIVRVARPEDYIEVWRLLLTSHRENGQFPLAPDKVDYYVQRALVPDAIPPDDPGPRGVFGVIGAPGATLEGLAFVTIACNWYTHVRHLEEMMVFVDPEHRQSNHARALIEWMKQQSDETKLKLLTGVISNERTEAKVRLYERMRLPKIGAFFLYGGTAPSSAAHALN